MGKDGQRWAKMAHLFGSYLFPSFPILGALSLPLSYTNLKKQKLTGRCNRIANSCNKSLFALVLYTETRKPSQAGSDTARAASQSF